MPVDEYGQNGTRPFGQPLCLTPDEDELNNNLVEGLPPLGTRTVRALAK